MIPVCIPQLDGHEREYVLDAIDTNWISSMGKFDGSNTSLLPDAY